jgi:hypothetical protein
MSRGWRGRRRRKRTWAAGERASKNIWKLAGQTARSRRIRPQAAARRVRG